MSRELELVEAKLPRGPRVSSVPVALVDLFIEGIFQVTCALRVERGFVFSTSLSERLKKKKPLSNPVIQRSMWHPRSEILQVDLCPSENIKLR